MLGKHHTEEVKERMRKMFSREGSPVFGTKHPNSSSKYYGVGIHNQNFIKNEKSYSYIRYRSKLRLDKKTILLGYYKSEILAAKGYDKYIIENGLKNPLNFPENYPERGQNNKNE